MRSAVKRVLFGVIYSFGIHLIIKRLQRRRVLILMYHGLVDRQSSGEWTQLPLRDFESQMRHISDHFNPVSLDDAVEYLSGNGSISPNPVVVTFDDGYESNFKLGPKILEEHNIPATVFVTSSLIRNENEEGEPLWFDAVTEMISSYGERTIDLTEYGLGRFDLGNIAGRQAAADRICEEMKGRDVERKRQILSAMMARLGASRVEDESHRGASWKEVADSAPLMTVGAHSVNHEILSKLGMDAARREISESKKTIEEKTGRKVFYFAYPNGRREDYTSETVEFVRESGYKAAVTTMEGLNEVGCNLFELKRIGVGSDIDMLWFKMAVTGTIDFLKRIGL